MKQITKYTRGNWIYLIELHLQKMNFVVNDDYSLPKENIPQLKIFLKQLEKYIEVDFTVAVLSSFPIFLFDYYGYRSILNILARK